MTTLAGTATYPDGTPASYGKVTVRLVASVDGLAPGYDGNRGIYGLSRANVASDGTWSVEGLTPNDDPDLVPAGTVYEVLVQVPGRPVAVAHARLTTAGGGVQQLRDVLTLPPTALPEPHTHPEAAAHPDLAAHDTLGLVTDTDPRMSDTRTPTAHAPSHATNGVDPVTPAAIGAETPAGAQAKVDTHGATPHGHADHPVDGAAGTPSLRTLGTTGTQAAAGTDPRLTDQRVPTNGSVTDAKVAAGADIAATKIAGTAVVQADLAGRLAKVFVAPAFGALVSHVNWTTFSQAGTSYFGGRNTSTGVQNAEAVYAVPSLAAGTWAFVLMHSAFTNRGIYTIATSVDGGGWTTQGTIDGYSATSVQTRSELAGLVLPLGTNQVRLTMATKNASSSGFFGAIDGLIGHRTAA